MEMRRDYYKKVEPLTKKKTVLEEALELSKKSYSSEVIPSIDTKKIETDKKVVSINKGDRQTNIFEDITKEVELPITKNSTIKFKGVNINQETKIDIRTWVDAKDKGWVRTNRGINFSADLIQEFFDCLLDLMEEMNVTAE